MTPVPHSAPGASSHNRATSATADGSQPRRGSFPPLQYLSVCSGIEAATQAFAPLGWQPVAFSEIEPFPCAVLAHHYPDVPNWGDMTKFQEWPDATVDVLCGGTPCQSFSVAGLRQGLGDPRGNLMLTFGAIAAKYRPTWLVWENVPGVLSSNKGRDFASFLGLIAGRIIEPPADGWRNSGIIPGIADAYGVAYRVLDAQHVRTRRFPHAVPQRRRRVFVVGYLGDWRRAAAVLFDRESLSGHPAPRREAGQGLAGTIDASASRSRGAGINPGGLTPISNSGDIGYCLTASAQGSLDAETETLIAFGAQNSHHQGDSVSFGFSPTLDKSKPPAVAFGVDGAAHCTRSGASKVDKPDSTTYVAQVPWAVRRLTPTECERLQGFPSVAKYVRINIWLDGKSQDNAAAEIQCTTGQSSALSAEENAFLQPAKNADRPLHTSRQNVDLPVVLHVQLNYETEEVQIHSQGKCLLSASTARRQNLFPLLMSPVDFALLIARLTEKAATKITDGRAGSQAPMQPSMVPESGSWSVSVSGAEIAGLVRSVVSDTIHLLPPITSTTLRSGLNIPTSEPTLETLCCSVVAAIASFIPEKIRQASSYAVTIETVRGFTDVPYRKKPGSPDGPRYKAIGNSWAVNAADWIAERIAEVDAWQPHSRMTGDRQPERFGCPVAAPLRASVVAQGLLSPGFHCQLPGAADVPGLFPNSTHCAAGGSPTA